MPFGPIVVNTKTYNASGDGRYVDSTTSFGTPQNYFLVKGGSLTKDRRNIVAAVTRILEKDITVNGATERRQASVQIVFTLPSSGFTAAEADGLLKDVSDFIDSSTGDRLLRGES